MNTKGKVTSYNKQTNKDCFGFGGSSTIDHIWPLSKNGSNGEENTQILSIRSNAEKENKTKGTINGVKFSITEVGRSSSDKKIGKMHIKKQDGWYEVLPTK